MRHEPHPIGPRDLSRVFTPFHNVVYYAPEIKAFIDAGMRGWWMSYFAYRAAPMGAVPAEVVIATFYNFAPRMVQRAVPAVPPSASSNRAAPRPSPRETDASSASRILRHLSRSRLAALRLATYRCGRLQGVLGEPPSPRTSNGRRRGARGGPRGVFRVALRKGWRENGVCFTYPLLILTEGPGETRMSHAQIIIDTILAHLSGVQAMYLFGIWGTEDKRPASDMDIAVLLAPQTAKAIGSLAMSELQVVLETALHDTVDRVNLRRVPTVFQKEIVTTGCRTYCADEDGAYAFAMVTLSLYQKLHEERAAILEEVRKSGRLYNV